MVVMCCATPDFMHYARRQQRCVTEYGLQHHIMEYDDRGSWLANIHFKATAVGRTLARFNDDVLYLDADMMIEEPVVMPPGDDVKVLYADDITKPGQWDHYTFDWNRLGESDYGEHYYIIQGRRMLFRCNKRVMEVVNDWERLSAIFWRLTTDEQTLMKALQLHPDVQVGDFPENVGVSRGQRHPDKPQGWL